MAGTGAGPYARKPARSPAFLGRQRPLACWSAPEEPRVFDSKVEVEERGHEGQHDDERYQLVIGLHEVSLSRAVPGVGASESELHLREDRWRWSRELRAAECQVGPPHQTGRLRRRRWPIFSCDETSETERREV